jgi:hypothetical protein
MRVAGAVLITQVLAASKPILTRIGISTCILRVVGLPGKWVLALALGWTRPRRQRIRHFDVAIHRRFIDLCSNIVGK